MNSNRNPGRFAGLLYVLISIPGIFALIYVPGKLIVDGNATATASNIAAHETLFRLGIAANLISQIVIEQHHVDSGSSQRLMTFGDRSTASNYLKLGFHLQQSH